MIILSSGDTNEHQELDQKTLIGLFQGCPKLHTVVIEIEGQLECIRFSRTSAGWNLVKGVFPRDTDYLLYRKYPSALQRVLELELLDDPSVAQFLM